MPGDREDYNTYSWYHTCFSWSARSQHSELYLNGNKVSEKRTPANRRLAPDGTLVLGQDQDTIGGGFDMGQAFGGEIYGLQVFKTKLGIAEVEEMYKAGMCSLFRFSTASEDVVLDWEDFLNAKRYGNVREISAGCIKCKWEILSYFVGQEITPDLISFIKTLF